MRKISSRFLLAVIFVCCYLACFPQPGSLDPSFGTNGIATATVNGNSINAVAVAVQPDGKIVVAAQTGSLSDGDIVLSRFNTNGTFDLSFNGSGSVLTNIHNDNVTDMKLQPDGKIVLSGYTKTKDSTFALLLRYTPDGAPDKSFGSGGIVKTAFETDILAYCLAIQPDGKIIAAGTVIYSWTVCDIMVLRVNPDGSPDTQFGGKGIALPNIGSDPGRALDIAICKDNSLLTAGYNSKNADYKFDLYHINQYGKTGWSDMNKEGRVSINVKDNFSKANTINLLSDGGILLSGTAGTDDKADFGLLKLTALGKPDKTFGSSGKVITDISKKAKQDNLSKVLLQNDGKILAAGESANGEMDGTIDITDVVLARYNSDGSFDNAFGNAGVARYAAIGKKYYTVSSMAIQPDGKIIVAGSVRGDKGIEQLMLLRYNN